MLGTLLNILHVLEHLIFTVAALLQMKKLKHRLVEWLLLPRAT